MARYRPRSTTLSRLVVLFLVAGLLFNPPILGVMDRLVLVMGLPLIYLYLFTAWGAVIGLTAWIMSALAQDPQEPKQDA